MNVALAVSDTISRQWLISRYMTVFVFAYTMLTGHGFMRAAANAVLALPATFFLSIAVVIAGVMAYNELLGMFENLP